MQNQLFVFLCFVFLATAVRPALTDEAPADDAKSVRSQLVAAQAKQQELVRKYNAIFRKIESGVEVTALRDAAQEAAKAAQEAEATNKQVLAARKTEVGTQAAIERLIDERLAGNEEVAELKTAVTALQEQIDDSDYEAELARFQLYYEKSPISRQAAKDQEVARLRDAAQKTARGKGSVAWNAYHAARNAKIAELAEAKPLLAKIEEAKGRKAELNEQRLAASQKLNKIRSVIEASQGQALRDARKATQVALNAPRLKELRDKAAEVRRAYQSKVTELVQANEQATALKAQVDVLNNTIRELSDRQAALLKK